MKRIAALKVAMLLLIWPAYLSAAPEGDFDNVKVQALSGKAKLQDPYRATERDISLLSEAGKINKADILLRRVIGSYLHLVIGLEGSSLTKIGTGYCGAGSERNVVWLKMRPGLQIQEIRSVRSRKRDRRCGTREHRAAPCTLPRMI